MGSDDSLSREVKMVRNEEAARACWPAFRELRPHLASQEEFVDRWRVQVNEGYQMVSVVEGDMVVAAAGYRILHTMAWGRILYIDDLVALATSRKTGLGTLLLRHLQQEARRLGCDAIHLDTGYQRHLAHLSYLRNGFRLDCHHLSWQVDRG